MPRSPQPLLRRLATAVGAVVVVLAIFAAGVLVGGHPEATGITRLPPPVRDAILGPDRTPVREVLRILEDGYYREVDAPRLERLSVDGLLRGLDDPYTFYLDPEQYAELQRDTEGVFFGVGMTVREGEGGAVVTGVYADSPAERAGVRTGDVIVEVDGRDVRRAPLDAVVRAIRGPEGTEVRVGFRRGERPRQLTLRRARIRVPVVTSRVETVDGRRVGYVRLAEFDRGAGDQLREAVRDLAGRDVRGLVLDLRGDPGGLVDEAVAVSGVFLPRGSDVVTIEGLHRARRTLRTNARPATDLPLVVLVDRNSASASEIVAGALRDNDRARLAGTRTFGKALVQTTRPLRNGGALRYTSARYLTPDGSDINRRGLQPPLRAADDPDTPADEALPVALRAAAGSP
ncbi:MAG TPA: S41 family peptidase [Miltoncostaeaceae bacterium]|nr:S41 family peptidase [Miltoncostaeaceae bacterium]